MSSTRQETKRSAKKLIEEVERGGFIYSGRHARIFIFRKSKAIEAGELKK